MISVIIPIYNVANYLSKCLKSLETQHYANVEILMIDDGSQDDSSRICKQFANRDTRFRYVYQNNHGVSYARNNGIKHAKGEYIVFVDADDYVEKSYFVELFNGIKQFDFVLCGYNLTDSANNIIHSNRVMMTAFPFTPFGIKFYPIKRRN